MNYFPKGLNNLVVLFFPQAFRSIVDRVGLGSLVPVEYFGNRNFDFLPDNKSVKRFEVCSFLLGAEPCVYLCKYTCLCESNYILLCTLLLNY